MAMVCTQNTKNLYIFALWPNKCRRHRYKFADDKISIELSDYKIEYNLATGSIQ